MTNSALVPASLHDVARAEMLGVVIDLDGTLIPFAARPSAAQLDGTAREIVLALGQCPRTQPIILSGRKREELAALFPDRDGPWLVAEHGSWRRREAEWVGLELDATPLHDVESQLHELAAGHPGAMVERKTWSVGLHYREVVESDREGTYVEALVALEPWLASHPEYEILEGSLVVEVRHRAANKGSGVDWIRSMLPSGARLVVIGDDLTDEDAFAALGPDDVAVAVGADERPTRAGARLANTHECRAFLRWLHDVRRSPTRDVPAAPSAVHEPVRSLASSLLVVSNRLPGAETGRERAVGGLASAVESALGERKGVWLGWSGRTVPAAGELAIDDRGARASFDLRPDEHALYYNGYANRSLWPVLHGFVGRARFSDDEWRAFVETNDTFAEHAMRLVERDGTVWAHDFHLLLLGRALRVRGHRGPRGLFLHVPFPSVDAFEALPQATHLLAAMLEYDLVGFQTRRHASNFLRAATELLGATETTRGVAFEGRWTQVGVFPVGIDAGEFREAADSPPDDEMSALRAMLGDRKLVLGVDRLDYTKGIVERLQAYAQLFDLAPTWRTKVTLLQVAVPSRASVPEYVAQRTLVEGEVGRINGELGEAHWIPVRYVRRTYDRRTLAHLYRAAQVGVVTPLRDGMNLVAKEYVASQDPSDPGVLVLSRFAGAADELTDAIIANPYDPTGTARAIARALTMSREERIARHARLRLAVQRNTPDEWAEAFLSSLARSR